MQCFHKFRSVIAALSILVSSGVSIAAEDIDVLVAFAPGTISLDTATFAIQREIDMTLILSRSLMPGRHVNFRPHLLPAAFPSGTATANIAYEFLRNEVDPLIKASRNTGSYVFPSDINSFDLVVMIVGSLKNDQGDFICGITRNIYSEFPTNSGWQLVSQPAENRFAIVLSDSSACAPNIDLGIAHEIGHIFGGDHQADGVHSSLDDVADLNGENFPLNYNHPHVTIDSQGFVDWQTVMTGRPASSAHQKKQYSSDAPGDVLFNTSEPAGDDESDMKTVVYSTWDALAAYRPKPSPNECVINVSQVCENNSVRAIVTPSLAGFTMTNIDLNYQLSGSSNWYPIYDGAPTCPIYNPPSNFMNSIVSALVTTVAGHVTGCTVNVIPIWCGNGDPL